MGKHICKLNHRGSTLLMVMICLALLGILGSLMLSVSMVNLQMKKVDINSKSNFYTCEKALEEIRAGLEELTATEIRNIYQSVMENYVIYASLSEDDRTSRIQSNIIDALKLTLGTDAGGIEDRFQNYLSEKEDYLINVNSSIPYTSGSNFILFNEVIIQYTREGYETKITTDLRITLPNFTLTEGEDTVSYSMNQPFERYALVADGTIYSENNSGENNITGNIYAGEGITIRDTGTHTHKVTLNGDYIITRGNIMVEDAASLSVGTPAVKPLLWAKNIFTAATSSYLPIYSNKTNLNLNAVCLIKDDLTLDARNSNAVLSGAYIGYTGGNTVLGSSIIINGSGSGMDLHGLSSLVLAGRAHISVEDSILFEDNPSNADVNIMTGESLALKSNQRAYLVPGEYIKLINGAITQTAYNNPITQKDLLTGVPSVQITAPSDPSKLNLVDYINSSKPYKIAAKQTVLGEVSTLRYYFLNLKSGKLADQYLRDYMGKYPSKLQTVDIFSYGDIILPENPDDIISAGNVMYYDSEDAAPIKYKEGLSGSCSSDQIVDSEIAAREFNTLSALFDSTDLKDKKISDITKLYFNMTHYLSPAQTAKKYTEEDKVVETSVLRSGISEVIYEYISGYTPKSGGFTYYNTLPASNSPLENITDPERKSIVVISGDASLADNSYFNGILITTGSVVIGENAVINGIIIADGAAAAPGNVTLKDNVRVNGRIITTGNIMLGTGCTVNCTGSTSFASGMTSEQFLKDIFASDAEMLWKMFVNPEVSIHMPQNSNSSDLVNINNLVTNENWQKN